MSSRLKKRTQDPPPTRQAANKRSRRSPISDEDEDSASESSESELSDLDGELEEETMNTLIAGATKGGVEDDEDEESDESDEDTPEEREDSYIYEDSNDISEPDSSTPAPKSKKLSFKPPPAARASTRRKSAVTPSRKSNLSKVSGPDDVHMKDTITVSGGRGGKKGAVGARGAAKKDEKQTIKLTLKMGKDKLRAATSAWTPPPNPTTDNRTGNNNATEESSSAEDKPSRGGARGRKVVQEEESSDEDDDDEDAEGEEVSDEDAEGEDDEDAEGEDDDGLNDEDAEGETDDEDMLDSDDDAEGTPDFRSRTGTPDMSRLTKRQKSRLDEVYSADLLELPTGIERPSAAKAIPLTADEQALKRAEMARRRKNLTDQRLEEEKMDTINKLLKKQTPKMRKNQGRQTGDATPAGTGGDTNLDGVAEAFPVPKMVRWVSNKDGIRVGVPDSWLTGPVGRVFEKQVESEGMIRARTWGRKMVEEIEDTAMSDVVPMEIEV